MINIKKYNYYRSFDDVASALKDSPLEIYSINGEWVEYSVDRIYSIGGKCVEYW